MRNQTTSSFAFANADVFIGIVGQHAFQKEDPKGNSFGFDSYDAEHKRKVPFYKNYGGTGSFDQEDNKG
ncbi:MAG: hypothetical protein N4A44_03115 [Alphaproteobacteria bacterium]|jgi:hypothetical protein|nr:hypothetical protein [Alphaproteobacteria bacterium]